MANSPRAPKPTVTSNSDGTVTLSQPQFSQPLPSPDPTKFTVAHGNDTPLYHLLNAKQVQPIPAPRIPNLTMELADSLGSAGAAKVAAIQKSGQLVFHCLGDTGSTKGPQSQSLVADKMVADYDEDDKTQVPAFCFHLGDIVYSFGEAKYYYDQFYEPYRNYPAPIYSLAGNHDGMVYRTDTASTLEAFLRNFVADKPVKTPESGNLMRTAMTQPAVYFMLQAPFVNIIGLYSNVLEDPGVISSEGGVFPVINDDQLTFLENALKQADKRGGAILITSHHPPFSGGGSHSGSPKMLAEIDAVCKKTGIWPHAHLSGHAHNYQRFTRTVNKMDIPYLVCGNGGHGLVPLKGAGGGPLRTPLKISDSILLENVDDQNFGYMRIVVNKEKLVIEYHAAVIGQQAKSPSDAVTVDLKTHEMISN